MLYQSRATLQLQDYPLYKVNYLFPSSNLTYIIIGMSLTDSQYLLLYSASGSITSKHVISFCYTSVAMINSQLLLFTVPSEGIVMLYDLKDSSFRRLQYKFKYQSLNDASIIVFGETDTFCIQEISSQKISKLSLSYYNVSEIDNLQSFADIQVPFKFQPTIRKGNNISLIIWYQFSTSDQIYFQSFDPRRNEVEKLKIHLCSMGEKHLKSEHPVNIIAMYRIWQYLNMFYVAIYGTSLLFSPNSPQNIPIVLQINQRNQINQYILGGINCSPFFVQFYHIGRYYLMKNPIFVQNASHKSISFFSCESSKQIQSHLISSQDTITIPSHTYETILTYNIQNEIATMIDVKLTKIMHEKQVYLHFMLHINEDFDDDLLHDVLRLLQAI